MSYVTENVRPGEQLVLEAGVSKVGVVFSLLWSWVFLFIPSLLIFLRLSHIELGITSKRIIVKSGLFSSNTMEATLDKVQNVNFRQSLFGKLFNYGTVIIQTGATFGKEGLRGVKDPKLVRDVLLEQIETYRVTQIREQAQAIATSMRG